MGDEGVIENLGVQSESYVKVKIEPESYAEVRVKIEEINVKEEEQISLTTLQQESKATLTKKRKRRKRRLTRLKHRKKPVPPIPWMGKIDRKSLILANKVKLRERRKLLEKALVSDAPNIMEELFPDIEENVVMDFNPRALFRKRYKWENQTNKKKQIINNNRASLQERRRVLEEAIANDEARRGILKASKSLASTEGGELELYAQMADEELNTLMEPEILIETQDECFVEYNAESTSMVDPEPSQLLHFLSTTTDFDPSMTNEQATAPQILSQLPSAYQQLIAGNGLKLNPKTHEVRFPESPITALVKVPVGKILCNFGHVIEQARKLERHTMRCGLGGEMVYHMTLKTGSVYEAIYRCSQPNCAVRMTIASDFYDKNATT